MTDDPDVDAELAALLETLASHEKSLTALLEAITTLEQSGILDLLSVVGTHDQSSNEQLYEAFADVPENRRLVQNLGLLGGGLARIDPDAVAATLEGDAVTSDELVDPPGLGAVGALRQFRDPDVRRGLGVVFRLLKHLGSRPSDFDAGNTGER